MGRSIKKGPFVDHHLLEKIQKAKAVKPANEDLGLLDGGDMFSRAGVAAE